jgi:tRNA 2-thiouridine synthesizing protein A
MTSINATNLAQPDTIVLTRRTLSELKSGEVLELQLSDPNSLHDIPTFCANNGHKLLIAYEKNDTLFFEIEKG